MRLFQRDDGSSGGGVGNRSRIDVIEFINRGHRLIRDSNYQSGDDKRSSKSAVSELKNLLEAISDELNRISETINHFENIEVEVSRVNFSQVFSGISKEYSIPFIENYKIILIYISKCEKLLNFSVEENDRSKGVKTALISIVRGFRDNFLKREFLDHIGRKNKSKDRLIDLYNRHIKMGEFKDSDILIQCIGFFIKLGNIDFINQISRKQSDRADIALLVRTIDEKIIRDYIERFSLLSLIEELNDSIVDISRKRLRIKNAQLIKGIGWKIELHESDLKKRFGIRREDIGVVTEIEEAKKPLKLKNFLEEIHNFNDSTENDLKFSIPTINEMRLLFELRNLERIDERSDVPKTVKVYPFLEEILFYGEDYVCFNSENRLVIMNFKKLDEPANDNSRDDNFFVKRSVNLTDKNDLEELRRGVIEFSENDRRIA